MSFEVTDFPDLYSNMEHRILAGLDGNRSLKDATRQVADDTRAEATALGWSPDLVDAITHYATKTGAALAGYVIDQGLATREQILNG